VSVLSRLEFLLLNNLADEPEMFSRLYVGLLDDLGHLDGNGHDGDTGVEDVAGALASLCARGLVTPLPGAAADAAAIAGHYADLDEELAALLADDAAPGLDYHYGRGEWRYRMTATGEAEWQRPEYAEFYPD